MPEATENRSKVQFIQAEICDNNLAPYATQALLTLFVRLKLCLK
jgi:hypothetical protein